MPYCMGLWYCSQKPEPIPSSQNCLLFPWLCAAWRTGWVMPIPLRHMWFLSYYCNGFPTGGCPHSAGKGCTNITALKEWRPFHVSQLTSPQEHVQRDGLIISRGCDRITGRDAMLCGVPCSMPVSMQRKAPVICQP